MLKFLVTVLLAIIIFVPACTFVAKLFNTSDQARISFIDFADALNKFDDSGDVKDTQLLILDKNTAVLVQKEGETGNIVYARAEAKATRMTEEGGGSKLGSLPEKKDILVVRKMEVATECKSKACACLCRDIIATGQDSETGGIRTESSRCDDFFCKTLDGVVLENSYGFGRIDEKFEGYDIRQPRRHFIDMHKSEGKITLREK